MRGARDGIAMVPAEVLELVGASKWQVLQDVHHGGLPMNEVCDVFML